MRRFAGWLLLVTLSLLAIPAHAQDDPCQAYLAREERVNLRSGPSLEDSIMGRLGSQDSYRISGQLEGVDGFMWYLLENGSWVRSSAVGLTGNCESIPAANPPFDYCLSRTEFAERPKLSGSEQLLESEHFLIHYTTQGADSAKLDYAEEVAAALEESWRHQIEVFNFPAPPPDCSEGGDERFDVYLVDLNGELDGYAQPETEIGDNPNSPEIEIYSSYSHLVLDNDYDYSADPLRAMRATAAHEFHHNIQLSYDYGDYYGGLDEAGAVWMETQTFPYDQTAVQYVIDLFMLPDRCIGYMPDDPQFNTRVYAEWLMIDSLVRDLGADSLLTLWRYRAEEEGMISFYDALMELGTTPQEVVKRMAIRNLLLDYELAPYFPSKVFIEGIIDGAATITPRRDGVMELGIEYLMIDTQEILTYDIQPSTLTLYAIGINQTTQQAQLFDLGQRGAFDPTPFDDAYLMILNTAQHEEHDECNLTDWTLTASAGAELPAIAEAETWNAAQYVAPIQREGLVEYHGTLDNADNAVSFALMDLQVGDVIYAYAESTSGDLDTYLTIDHALGSEHYDPQGEFLAEDDDSGGNLNSLLEYTIEKPGDYDVYLFPIGDDVGDYRVVIGINERIFPEGKEPQVSDYTFEIVSRDDKLREFTGSLANSDDQVIIEIDDLELGDMIYAYAESTRGDLDSYLMLLDKNMESVIEDDDSGGDLNAALKYQVKVANEYYLMLFSLNDTAGEYRLLIGVNETAH